MKDRFPRLFEPAKIGTMEVKNRLLCGPHASRHVTKNSAVTEGLLAYFLERARTGVGMVVIEGTYSAQRRPYLLYIGSDETIPSLRHLSDTIHEGGAKAVIQLCTLEGRADQHEPVSASSVPNPFTGLTARAITIEELEWLVETVAEGARRAKDAGFDAVMLHGSHSYLIAELLSPYTNRRDDRYGGSPENRARFALELVQRIRDKTGPDYPIMVRLLGDDRFGYFSAQDAAGVAKMLEDAGVCFIDITTGIMECMDWQGLPDRIPRASNVDAAEVIKKAVSIPVSVHGRINDLYLAERIIERGMADFVGMVRPLLADPEMIHKAGEGRTDEIRKCIACNRCVDFDWEKPDPIRCSVNPFAGRESEILENELKPADPAKKVLVIGGGPAGMEAARVATLRGHRVTLWEKADRLGGQLHLACLPPNKGGLQSVIDYLTGQMEKLGVTVELGKEATPESVMAFGPDVAIVAVGATPKLPDIPGADLAKVVTASDVLTGKSQTGQQCVVLAVDSIGCEVAEFLSDRYRDVTIVDPSPLVASDNFGYSTLIRHTAIVRDLKRKMVEIRTGTRPLAITEEGVTVMDGSGNQETLPADTVVAALGFTPKKELFEALEDRIRVYQIGDCADSAGRIMDAIHAGAEVAISI